MKEQQQRGARRSPAKEAAWREVIREWRASGKTLPTFADERGLSRWTVRSWCTELKKRDAERAPEHRASAGAPANLEVPSAAVVSLVPVRVVKVRPEPDGGIGHSRAARLPGSRCEQENAGGAGGGVIEIVPFGQVRIRVSVDFDPRTLRAVLDVLEAPC
jgi:hypothetical protein